MENKTQVAAAPATGQHSAGPWKVIGGTEVWTEAGYSRIASTSGAYSPHSLEVRRANARLIASAPALLAERDALRLALGTMLIQAPHVLGAKQARSALGII